MKNTTQVSKWRALKAGRWFLLTFMSVASMSPPAEADRLGAQKEALTVIADFADRLCGKVSLEGKEENLELSGEAKVELSDLIKKLANLGIEGAGKHQKSEYQGVLQKDLVTALRESADCKQKVFQELKGELLENRNEVDPPPRGSGGNSLPPERRPRVAVLNCESKAQGSADLVDYCTNALSTSLARTGRLLLVEREKINAILEEQGFSQVGDPSTAIQLRRLLGAQYLVIGTIESAARGQDCSQFKGYGITIENCTYSVKVTVKVTDTTTGAVVYSDVNSASQTTQKTPYLSPGGVSTHNLLDDALSPLAKAASRQIASSAGNKKE